MKISKCLLLFLSIAMGFAADKKDGPFRPEPLDSYATKMTAQGVTVAAVPYDDPEEIKKAFGKLNPYEHGVLPVLLLMKNNTDKALSLSGLETTYIAPRSRKVESTPAADVMYLNAGGKPKLRTSNIPTGGINIKVPKNPLKNDVIIERAFSAKMLPPGDTAYGFLYFQTGHTRGTSLYLSGLTEAGTGKALFFFEIPLD